MQLNSIIWSATAIKQVSKAIEYIRQDSVQNAGKFNNKLLNKLELVVNNPGICAPDKYKIK